MTHFKEKSTLDLKKKKKIIPKAFKMCFDTTFVVMHFTM